MTNEEKLCSFMEPKPATIPRRGELSRLRWWQRSWCGGEILPADLTLERLRLIEDKLTAEQWKRYDGYLYAFLPVKDDKPFSRCEDWEVRRAFVHASARQKIDALAAVLDTEGRGR